MNFTLWYNSNVETFPATTVFALNNHISYDYLMSTKNNNYMSSTVLDNLNRLT